MAKTFAQFIDHTLLKQDATKQMIEQLIAEAKKYSFKAVCVHPSWVTFCAEHLRHTNIAVCTVIGFPLGAGTTATKVFAAKEAIANGATEIDMVINIGRLKSNDVNYIENELEQLIAAIKPKAQLKVIIETALLTKEEKITVLQIAKQCGVHFVKTSTGFASGGATTEDVQLMKQIVGQTIQVKASGGIRTFADMQKMIKAGATRIGASAGVEIMKEIEQKLTK